MNPLWNRVILAGFSTEFGQSNEKFLGYVDLLGTKYESECIATGFGAYIALPILRRHLEKVTPAHLLEEQEARKLMEDCMRVLYYRDARSLDRIQISTVSRDKGVVIGKPYRIETDWEFGRHVQGYGA